MTPFRAHYERSRGLSPARQLEEAADYLEHPLVLLTEFLESCHIVERELDPDQSLKAAADDQGELVLEPFAARTELQVRDPLGNLELLICVSGALSPLPGAEHPALARRGLDYIAVRSDAPFVVLGAAQGDPDETSYLLLLRALNGFAELATPFQLLKLGRDLFGASLPPDAAFDLQIALEEHEAEPLLVSLGELTRDLADMFIRGISSSQELADMIGSVECLTFVPGSQGTTRELLLRWRV